MNKPILIHDNNTTAATSITNQISSEMKSDNIDLDIIDFLDTQIFIKEFDVVVIKDSLSNNYLEFYGLLLAHHIRLSDNKKVKYLPIVIISDLNMYQLSKLTSLSNICHTEGTYLVDNILKKDLKGLSVDRFNDSFLNLIDLQPPANYDSKHSIANEWAMYQWASLLGLTTKSIKKNIDLVSSLLYFKYLINKYHLQVNLKGRINQTENHGTVLFIDDKWNDGWKDIMESFIRQQYTNIILETLKYDFEKSSIEELKIILKEEIKTIKPQVVLLDLRLFDNDNVLVLSKKKSINKLSGIQIINEIKKNKSWNTNNYVYCLW